MQRELPNLDWLRVFAATATTESFAVAAGQLAVTPGAVSQRIKALEAFLGVDLFQRYAQGVRLTEAGKRYAQRVLPPLDQLTAATREITEAEAAKPVRITILPALAQLWLGPRMQDLYRQHESMWVEIWADAAVVDLRNTAAFDLAIRYGRPPFPGCEHRELLFDELAPVASPQVAEGPLGPAGLPEGAPLMADTYWQNDLDEWLRSTGQARPPNLAVQTFSLYSMAVEAVMSGRGFMIGHTSLVADLVAEGRLRYLSHQRVVTANQFYLLTRASTPPSKPAKTFVDWLLTQ